MREYLGYFERTNGQDESFRSFKNNVTKCQQMSNTDRTPNEANAQQLSRKWPKNLSTLGSLIERPMIGRGKLSLKILVLSFVPTETLHRH